MAVTKGNKLFGVAGPPSQAVSGDLPADPSHSSVPVSHHGGRRKVERGQNMWDGIMGLVGCPYSMWEMGNLHHLPFASAVDCPHHRIAAQLLFLLLC